MAFPRKRCEETNVLVYKKVAGGVGVFFFFLEHPNCIPRKPAIKRLRSCLFYGSADVTLWQVRAPSAAPRYLSVGVIPQQ